VPVEVLEIVNHEVGLKFSWEEDNSFVDIGPSGPDSPSIYEGVNVHDKVTGRSRFPYTLEGLEAAMNEWLRDNPWVREC